MTIRGIFLILFFIFTFVFGICAQTTQVIVDPTKTAPALKATAAEEKLIKSLLPKVRRIWTSDTCEESFSITGVASGAFTKKDSTQKAFLYEFCETGNGLANDGILITEAGRVVAHFIYEGASTGGLNSLPDLNGNGVDELLITNYGGMHQGISGTGIDVIEFFGKSLKEIGATEIEYAEETEKGEKGYSYKISVKTGASPVFYREKFVKKGKTWRKVGNVAKAEMFKLDYKYNAVK
ncbi:MAG: hypothetical protein M3033_10460 [Acidobacteriota bacterium]|nr:hypothetical protein [Acidobacteriota bacterium]